MSASPLFQTKKGLQVITLLSHWLSRVITRQRPIGYLINAITRLIKLLGVSS